MTGEVRLLLLWVLGAGLLLIVALFLGHRISLLRDRIDTILALLEKAQGVKLLNEIDGLILRITQFETRLDGLEKDRVADREMFLDTNRHMLKAMDSLRHEWQDSGAQIAMAVSAQIRGIIDADVRRIVRDEFFKLNQDKE